MEEEEEVKLEEMDVKEEEEEVKSEETEVKEEEKELKEEEEEEEEEVLFLFWPAVCSLSCVAWHPRTVGASPAGEPAQGSG